MEYIVILNCLKVVFYLCKVYKLIWLVYFFICLCILIKEKRYYNICMVLCFNVIGGMYIKFLYFLSLILVL